MKPVLMNFPLKQIKCPLFFFSCFLDKGETDQMQIKIPPEKWGNDENEEEKPMISKKTFEFAIGF